MAVVDPVVVILNVMLILATYNMLVPGSAIYGLEQQMKKLRRELHNKPEENGSSTTAVDALLNLVGGDYRKINPMDAAFAMCILIVNFVYFPFRTTA